MKWNIRAERSQKTTDTKEILETLLQNRGLTTKKEQEAFLHPARNLLKKDFFDTEELHKALARIARAIKNNEQIIVYSDYDVDGITGSAILWETIHDLGGRVMPFVPDRFKHGYGLSEKGIADILSEYPDVKLVITVDNGITAAREVSLFSEKGVDVIITDHHTIPEQKPDAQAIVHTTELSGSGVAYVFSTLIYAHFAKTYKKESEHIALAAIGTIADLVPLVGANRVIAYYGLDALRKTKRIGLLALFDVVSITPAEIEAYHIGFVIGPRINASGRLAQGLEALQLLCTKDRTRALYLAQRLHDLNTERQDIMRSAFVHAENRITETTNLLFVYDESYHEGVIGLIAGNLVDTFYRPAVVATIKGDMVKASARSIRGVNIHTLLSKASDFYDNFGGHPMAAGFSVKKSKLSELERVLQEVFATHVTDDLFERELRIDMSLSLRSITSDLYAALQACKPYGVGNPEPVFCTDEITVTDARVVGRDGAHLKLRVKQGNMQFDAMGFGMGECYGSLGTNDISIAYAIMENEWNGKKSLQLKIKDIK